MERAPLFLVAAAFGALGHQVLYWKGILSRNDPIHLWMFLISIFHVFVGSGIGFLMGYNFDSLPLAVCLGAIWPTFFKAMEDVNFLRKTLREKFSLPNLEC